MTDELTGGRPDDPDPVPARDAGAGAAAARRRRSRAGGGVAVAGDPARAALPREPGAARALPPRARARGRRRAVRLLRATRAAGRLRHAAGPAHRSGSGRVGARGRGPLLPALRPAPVLAPVRGGSVGRHRDRAARRRPVAVGLLPAQHAAGDVADARLARGAPDPARRGASAGPPPLLARRGEL